MDYKIIQLKNGLRLVLVPKSSTEVVTAMIMFKVGSRNETDDIAGIAHVLEHMHYKGTKKRPTGLKIAEFIESIGAQHNAFTCKEYTGYHAKLLPKHIPLAFDFLSDNLSNSLFDEKELEKEREVIVQEINMYSDLPMEVAETNFEKVIFGDNALGRDVIGFKKTVRATTRQKLIDFKEKYYRAPNAVLALAGNFGEYSEAEIKSLAEKYFKFSDKNVEKVLPVQIADEKTPSIVEKKTEQSHLVLGFETVSFNHPDFFALELLAIVLGGSMSSRMFEEVREKRGLAYSIKTETANFSESGTIYTKAGVEHEKAYEAIGAILNQYEKIKTKEISEAELKKAKEIICSNTLVRFEDSEDLAYHFASETLSAKTFLPPAELIKAYQKISASDILKVAQKYLIKEKIGLSFVGEKIDREKLEKILN